MPRGGSTSSSALQSTTTAEAVAEEIAEDAPKEIFRTDYKPLSYKVSNVSMNFDIRDGKTIVERWDNSVIDLWVYMIFACPYLVNIHLIYTYYLM